MYYDPERITETPLIRLAPELGADDISAVANIYLTDFESERGKATSIVRENVVFFEALKAKIEEIEPDPVRANAMLRGSALIIMANQHRLNIDDLYARLFPTPNSSIEEAA